VTGPSPPRVRTSPLQLIRNVRGRLQAPHFHPPGRPAPDAKTPNSSTRP